MTRVRSVLASSRTMARTVAGLYLAGAVLALALSSQTPPDRGTIAMLGSAVAAIGIAIGLLLWGDRLRLVHYQLLVAAGTILVTVGIYETSSPVMAMSLASLYVTVACAAFFLTWPPTAVQIGFSVGCAMTVLTLHPGLPWWSGLIVSGTTVTVGIGVGVLARLASDADVDVLTGALNRRGFERALTLEINRAERTGPAPALIAVAVDRFGAMNDHFGYRAADKFLRHLVESWLKLLAPGQVLARYGGDEFVVLLPEGTEQSAITLAEDLKAAVTVGCSAGVTVWQPGESPTFLVSRAQVGLYRAQQTGRNRTVLEAPRWSPAAVELADAITGEALDVLYQPIVNLLEGGTVVGVEALVRWSSATRPGATPNDVIQLAEDNGLIAGVDRFVLHRACLDAHVLQHAMSDGLLMLNVNVSGLELIEPDYIARVEEVLATTGWPARQLVLEVTESVLAVDTPTATAALHELRAHDVRIAIDDFGAGYSSLSRIQTLPADFLKLDGSFTAAITAESVLAPPLLKVIASLGVALAMPVIVEGVENAHQAAVLMSRGFGMAQGYHYGRPQPCAAMADSLVHHVS